MGVRVLPGAPYAAVAQLVEHGIEDPGVGGSIPSCGTIYIRENKMNKYVTYNHLQDPVKSFEDLKGRVLSKVVNLDDYELRFYLTEDHYVRMYHMQDCCESVSIEDIVGDLDDLVGTPLLLVEEVSNYEPEDVVCSDPDWYESETWTYYRFRTMKGSVDIRWYGTSNGYYSESVDIEIVR